MNIKITYEPRAVGYGEAPHTWEEAKVQRRRWLKGTYDSNRISLLRMLITGINRKDGPLLEGAIQALLPSYSTLTILCFVILIIQGILNLIIGPIFNITIITIWAVILVILFIYPIFGLKLANAPSKAYIAILLGPFFILWRTWLALTVRYSNREILWDRTPHGENTFNKVIKS